MFDSNTRLKNTVMIIVFISSSVVQDVCSVVGTIGNTWERVEVELNSSNSPKTCSLDGLDILVIDGDLMKK